MIIDDINSNACDYCRCVKTNASDYRDFSMFWSAVAVSWHSGASTEWARAWTLNSSEDDDEDKDGDDDGKGGADGNNYD